MKNIDFQLTTANKTAPMNPTYKTTFLFIFFSIFFFKLSDNIAEKCVLIFETVYLCLFSHTQWLHCNLLDINRYSISAYMATETPFCLQFDCGFSSNLASNANGIGTMDNGHWTMDNNGSDFRSFFFLVFRINHKSTLHADYFIRI